MDLYYSMRHGPIQQDGPILIMRHGLTEHETWTFTEGTYTEHET